MAALAGLTVLVVLDEGEAELLRRRVHEYQRAHPGSAPAVADRLSVNGAPALPGLESGTHSHLLQMLVNARTLGTVARAAVQQV